MSETHDLHSDVLLAREMIELAASIALPRFRGKFGVTDKSDGTPVSEVDQEIDRALCELLHHRRPEDGVLSEESSEKAGVGGGPDRRWIIDPIDGTANFIAGNPSWGTHVALQVSETTKDEPNEQAEELVIGFISRPAMNSSWWAVKGQGAYKCPLVEDATPEDIHVSNCASFSQSRVTLWGEHAASKTYFQRAAKWIEPRFEAILDVAEGRMEGCVDLTGKPWDLAPYVLLVEEAGGQFSDLAGGRRIDSGGGCFSNGGVAGNVHHELIKAFTPFTEGEI